MIKLEGDVEFFNILYIWNPPNVRIDIENVITLESNYPLSDNQDAINNDNAGTVTENNLNFDICKFILVFVFTDI